MGKTLFDKLWDRHVITGEEGQAQLLYVDLHMIHEVTTPQAFEGLRRRHFMDHMQIDIKQLRLPFFSCDHMPIP
nr:MAG TPA: isopropylmalate isomerase large subunit [Caudoviricetes sp.]